MGQSMAMLYKQICYGKLVLSESFDLAKIIKEQINLLYIVFDCYESTSRMY